MAMIRSSQPVKIPFALGESEPDQSCYQSLEVNPPYGAMIRNSRLAAGSIALVSPLWRLGLAGSIAQVHVHLCTHVERLILASLNAKHQVPDLIRRHIPLT